MEKLDLQKEWNFVVFEKHKEKPNPDNRLKREVLFTLELLLNHKQPLTPFLIMIYQKTKQFYLTY